MDVKKFGAFLAVTRKKKDDAGTAGREDRGYRQSGQSLGKRIGISGYYNDGTIGRCTWNIVIRTDAVRKIK